MIDEKFELNPKKISEFYGQEQHIKVLKTAVYVAKEKNTCIDHVLLHGNSGLGKTTLAKIISNELQSKFIYISAPSISSILDLVSIFSSIQENDVVFIDEIHGISKKLEEVLYTVMENYKLAFIYSSEEDAKPLEIELPKFTLIAATTMVYRVSTPLRNRFPIQIKLEDYTIDAIQKMAGRLFKKVKIPITIEALNLIAKSSRKNPRLLKNTCKRIFDYVFYNKIETVDIKEVKEVLKQLKIYEDGLNEIDIKLLFTMYYNLNNRPISLETAALLLGENKYDITTIHEPYLVENGFIIRTKRGRILSEKGIEYAKSLKKK